MENIAWGELQKTGTKQPGIGALRFFEEQHAQRRQGKRETVRPAVPAGVPGVRAAAVAHAAAVVFLRVAIEDLFPEAALRNADFIILAGDRREVTHNNDRFLRVLPLAAQGGKARRVLPLAQKTQNAVLPVVAVDPFETVLLKIVRV